MGLDRMIDIKCDIVYWWLWSVIDGESWEVLEMATSSRHNILPETKCTKETECIESCQFSCTQYTLPL